jgi:hypothetical protein
MGRSAVVSLDFFILVAVQVHSRETGTDGIVTLWHYSGKMPVQLAYQSFTALETFMSFHRTFVVVALLAGSICYASDNKHSDMTAAEFSTQKALFIQQLDDGKTYAEITPEHRQQVVATLGRMDARLQRAGSIDQLGETERIDFYNDQELVNTLLTNAKQDSRMICERVEAVGSHRPKNFCQTFAQLRRQEESAQQSMQNVNKVSPPDPNSH